LGDTYGIEQLIVSYFFSGSSGRSNSLVHFVEHSRSREPSICPATQETEPVVESRGSLPSLQQSAKSSTLVYRLLLQTGEEQSFIAQGPFDNLQTLCGHTVFARATCTNPVTSYILCTTFKRACEVF